MSYRVLGYLGAPETPAPEAAPDTASFEDPFAPLTTSRGFVKVPSSDVRQYVQTTLIILAVGFGAGVGVGAIFGNILGEKKGLTKGIAGVFRNPRRRRSSRRRRRSSRPRRNTRKRTLKRYLIKEAGGSFFEVHAYTKEGALRQARKESRYDVRVVRSEPIKKNAGKRRTSARKRKRGRPTVTAVREDLLTVKLPEGYYDVEIRAGKVHVGRLRSRHVLDVKKMNVSLMSPIVGTVYDTGTKFRAVPRDYDAPVEEFGTLAGAVKHLIRHRRAA